MKDEREGLLKDIAKLKQALEQLAVRQQGKHHHDVSILGELSAFVHH